MSEHTHKCDCSGCHEKALTSLAEAHKLCACDHSDSAGVTIKNGRCPKCGYIFVGSQVKGLERELAEAHSEIKVLRGALESLLAESKSREGWSHSQERSKQALAAHRAKYPRKPHSEGDYLA